MEIQVARCLAHILMVIYTEVMPLLVSKEPPVAKVQPLAGDYWRYLAKILAKL